MYEWSFSIESQLTSSMALEVRYVGTSAIELGHFHFFGNQAVPGPGDIQTRRLYPDFGFTAQMGSGSNANYNGLQVQFTRRMSNGLQFLAGYTFARNISNNEGEEGGYSDGGAPLGQNDNDQRNERGLTVNDVRHRFTFSSMYELPFGKGRRWLANSNALVNGILGGWEFTALASFQTGFPITPKSGSDFANVGTGTPRPDRICNGNLPSGDRKVARWFDTSCFTNEFLIADNNNGIFRFGNSGRSILTGPGIQNFDFSLLKDFHITTQDAISGTTLKDGTDYYFAVTSYAVNTSASENRVLESPLKAVTVRPQRLTSAVTPSMIRAVPNPYLAHSTYEQNQFARRIRFVNCPAQCTIRIYNLAGQLVRTLTKNDASTSVVDWDVQTENRLPVGSGIYIYHVESPAGSNVGRLIVFMEKERLNNF